MDKCVYNLSNSKWTFPNEQVIWIISSDDKKLCMNETQKHSLLFWEKLIFEFRYFSDNSMDVGSFI